MKMMRLFLAVLFAVLICYIPVTVQAADPARSFDGGPLGVTVYDLTGLYEQASIMIPVNGDEMEVISIPVNVTVAPQRRGFLVVQFVGGFMFPYYNPDTTHIDVAMDCTVNHVVSREYGCGMTPAVSIEVGSIYASIPATYFIRNLPSGAHEIGIQVSAQSRPQGPIFQGIFTPSISSLIVSLYEQK